MGKKTKQGKGRLDKYYFMAKEQGFRCRAAFKLIQLNKKYDFLTQAKCVVDLCAAPGGWLQVCAKYMPIASIKIGVDLDPIPAIKGCVTFQCDITTQRCLSLIRKELKHFKADCVLNDGAPNVGSNWQMDAYNQIELSLHALKLATEVLRKGGWFITKLFRSKDYNAFMYVANQLFTKVESSKPQSSRNTSAEIFMVCQGYRAPDVIDPKLLDPAYALMYVEDDKVQATDNITSLKKLLETKKKHRSGYDREILYQECSFMDFLQSTNPHEFLTNFNKFTLNDEVMKAIENYKPPTDLDIICQDLKVCGRREFSILLKLRYKYNVTIDKAAKEAKQAKYQQKLEQEDGEKTQEQIEAEVDRELEATIKKFDQQKKRAAKKERERETKQDLRKKMSVIATTSINNDEELTLDRKTWQKLKEVDVDDLQNFLPEEVDSQDEENQPHKTTLRYRELKDQIGEAYSESEDGNDSDVSEDEKVTRIDRMAREIEDSMKQQNIYKMVKTSKAEKKERKTKELIELQRQKKMDESDDEMVLNEEIMTSGSQARKTQSIDPDASDYSENDDDLDEEREIRRLAHEQAKILRKQKLEQEEQEEDEEEKQLFLNPLLAFKKEKAKKTGGDDSGEDVSEWSDDDKYEPKETRAEARERKEKERKLLGKRKRDGMLEDIDDVQAFFKNDAIEEVPQEEIKRRKGSDELPSGYSSMDSDEIAETRALAKKMLRKKFREQTVSDSYSRYANEDDETVIPTWFLEDEAKFNMPNINLTKEEVDEEKRQLREWNARPSKKVMEAKGRKKAKLARAMNKVKAKAQVIANQESAEGTKMRQIQKMYRKEKAKFKEEKKYVVNRSHNSTGQMKGGRNVKFVDSRMRSDVRNQKLKKKKKGGQGMRNAKGGRSKSKGRN